MNIGVLGSGFIVQIFTENAKMFKQFHLRAIWGRHEDKIKAFTDFDYYTTDLNELLSDKKIDVVYVALPNSLHYEYAYKALKAGKHVILEKPFCLTYQQAKKLADYAKKNQLLLYEAIMTIHSPLYNEMKKYLNKLGDIKMIEGNFSQYSRRYDKFKQGIVLPAFDASLAGGALMDLGVYNIHFVVGMFGVPEKVYYYPNIEKGVDTSGVLILDYGNFKASLINAKDCKSDSYMIVQGDQAYLRCNTTSSRCSDFSYVKNNGESEHISEDSDEFTGWKYLYGEFIKLYNRKNYQKCYEYLDHSLKVQKVLEQARNSCGMDD